MIHRVLYRGISSKIPKKEFAKTYDSRIVERGWSEWWEQNGYFKPNQVVENEKQKFTMIFPPPNVTGKLHIGHALTVSIEDAMIRWRRMQGHHVQWIPGTDHAGIATQTVVEKQLYREQKLTRHQLGRDKFLDKVWEWRNQYGSEITKQMRRMGGSWDWSQEYFTMDDKRSQAVTNAFIHLFDIGLIYRDNLLVNWCCALQTVISDIEVEYEDIPGRTHLTLDRHSNPVEFGVLHNFAYPIVESNGRVTGEEIIVSTTRIETMLGDVAVAVHPLDERYQKYHGMWCQHPFTKKLIPIVTDEILVDSELGTGAVKITPGHDMNDFACAKRHDLPILNIMNEDGTLNSAAANMKLENVDRLDARQAVIDALRHVGLYRGCTSHEMRIARCSRTGDIIEPLIKAQWYLKCGQLAERVLSSTKSGDITVHPSFFENQWKRWLENTHDWCVSRQLWWGHRIPAYRVVADDLKKEIWVSALTEEEAKEKAKRKLEAENLSVAGFHVERDSDVFDTWFSSALLPLSAAGWTGPSETPPFQYPYECIESGSDILFFWIARMSMLCQHFTGAPPFKHILLHPMVRDSQGRKMSKSLGNVIDPLHVIDGVSHSDLEKGLISGNLDPKEIETAKALLVKEFPDGIQRCGADALRFTLIDYTQNIRQLNLDINRVYSVSHFCNKIWNLFRYSYGKFEQKSFRANGHDQPPEAAKFLLNQFILSRFVDTVQKIESGFERFELHECTTALNKFIVGDLCDVFVEFSKPVFKQSQDSEEVIETLNTLWFCLANSLKILHPFMPFLTEELWQHSKSFSNDSLSESISTAEYPSFSKFKAYHDVQLETNMKIILDIIHATRSLRMTNNIKSQQSIPLKILLYEDSALIEPTIQQYLNEIKSFARVEPISIANDSQYSGSEGLVHVVSPALKISVPANVLSHSSGNSAAEIQRLNGRLSKLKPMMEKLRISLSSPKLPEKIRLQQEAKLAAFEEEMTQIENNLKLYNHK